jgi:hypothetical protein
VANIAYSSLLDLGGFPGDNVFVVLHLCSEEGVNATFIPVGSDANVQRTKAGFEKDDWFFSRCVDKLVDYMKKGVRCEGVHVMYNTPDQLVSSSSDDARAITVVHEHDVTAVAGEFISAVCRE